MKDQALGMFALDNWEFTENIKKKKKISPKTEKASFYGQQKPGKNHRAQAQTLKRLFKNQSVYISDIIKTWSLAGSCSYAS